MKGLRFETLRLVSPDLEALAHSKRTEGSDEKFQGRGSFFSPAPDAALQHFLA
jgi:hypothetical protein